MAAFALSVAAELTSKCGAIRLYNGVIIFMSPDAPNKTVMTKKSEWPGEEGEFHELLLKWQAGDSRAAARIAFLYAKAGDYQKSVTWARFSQETELRDSLFEDGMRLRDVAPSFALKYFLGAYKRIHPDAVFQLHNLLNSYSAVQLDIEDEEYAALLAEISGLIAKKQVNDEKMAMLTGAFPVLFQEVFGPADFSNAQWRTGSLFLVQRGVHQFAVTARHVVDNFGANPEHFRLVLPNYEAVLPICAAHTSTPEAAAQDDDGMDVFAWQIDQEFESDRTLEWWAWKLDQWVATMADIQIGQRLYAAGFPRTDNDFDLDTWKINATPVIIKGTYQGSYGTTVHTMLYDGECLGDPDGMSGGPVFAELDGRFHYVGMIVRGGGNRLHFIDSTYIIELLDRVGKDASTTI